MPALLSAFCSVHVLSAVLALADTCACGPSLEFTCLPLRLCGRCVGVLVAAAEKFGLPIHAIGVGETADDLRGFDANEVSRIIAGVERVRK